MIGEYENEFKELIKNINMDEIDEDITKEDIIMWGYKDWDDFWESNI